MNAIAKHAKRYWSDDRGATAIEYGLIVSVMSVVLIPAVGFFSGAFASWAAQIVDEFATVTGN